MDYTTNKNLAKPTENEIYDLATVNENMDKIDAALKTNDDAITQLTEKMKKYSDKRVANVKVTKENTYQKIISSETLPAGIYIVIATAECIKDSDSDNLTAWLSIPHPNATPSTGDDNAIKFPARERYSTISYATILKLNVSSEISAYIYSGSTVFPFNVSLKVTRVG